MQIQKIFKKFIVSFLMMITLLSSNNFVFAAEDYGGLVPCGGPNSSNPCTADFLFGKTSAKPTDNKVPVWTTLINTTLSISGIILLAFFFIGGVMLMMSGLPGANFKKYRETAYGMMKNSLIGMLIVFFAFTIIKTLLYFLVGADWVMYFGQ